MTSDNEIQIEQWMADFKIKQPPQEMMSTYDEELFRKIASPAVSISLPLVLTLAVSMACGVWIYAHFSRPTPMALPVATQEAVESIQSSPEQKVMPDTPVMGEIPQTDLSENQWDQVSRDLFILELLGEELPIDDLERAISDVDLVTQNIQMSTTI